jgi:polysaccharide export outer membrane protein
MQRTLRLLPLGALLAAAFLLSGCRNLSYSDPNPSARYFDREGGGRQGDVASTAPVVPATPPQAGSAESASKTSVGDLLTINFTDIPPGVLPPEMRVRVGSDGMITLPFNVQVKALGKTPTELQAEIRGAYVPTWFVNLTPVVKADDRYYYVGGEVKVSGPKVHIGDVTVLRAIDTAGGFTDFAKKTAIELRRAATGETIIINEKKARQDPKLDLPVYVNDRITVPRRF